ncbi:hypothetical protein MKW98_014532 [Papaver atlanticum]|uniref:RING-type E3 ubiquitin transferase n=1 Tax=Papaver atlanticum TaxID=357466 RepID=A0AAD4SM55_9MAGN|nr:hypothetical protein MKW98_014532 [Papaver atlanticum]
MTSTKTSSSDGSHSLSPTSMASTTLVAVAVRGSSMGSRQAVRWAVDNLIPIADRFVLVHVMPPINSIPTPSGNRIQISEMDRTVVDMYRQERKAKCEEIFLPFKTLCRSKEMETLILEDENPAYALLKYITRAGCNNLVLGSSSSSNYVGRKLQGQDVPTTLMNFVTTTCNIFVVSRTKVISKLIDSYSNREGAEDNRNHEFSVTINREVSTIHPPSEASEYGDYSAPVSEVFTEVPSRKFTNGDSFAGATVNYNQAMKRQMSRTNGKKNLLELPIDKEHDFMASAFRESKKFELQSELTGLQSELRHTLEMYDRACEDLVHIQKKIQTVSSECVEEASKTRAVIEREVMWNKIAEEEKSNYLAVTKELEVARQTLAQEIHERQKAELSVITTFSERQVLVDALFSGDRRYKRFTRDEIVVATDSFSEAKIIGEGGYGKVYKCTLDHTPMAVKVLHPQEFGTKKEEFLMEVEVLSQLCHPHLVLLLGGCPEIGCLVYEYMENGNLEERLFCSGGTEPLPWFIRFRIAYEVACGLAFLHGTKPQPIIHRDLKPGNILLGRNYVSKIGDVGFAKFVTSVVPDNVSMCRNSTLAGTLNYMDPEYYRTGVIRPKSDVYSFGIIVLQMLTARPASGLLMSVENAISNGSFVDILDKSITDWPLPEAQELAWLALRCSRLRCRDRPDLKSDVLPVLERLSNLASVQLQKADNYMPSYYFCPILQEVMEDPHIAADGFTYEYSAIQKWVEKQKVSPVTRVILPHVRLTPNITLRTAIQEWKQQHFESS